MSWMRFLHRKRSDSELQDEIEAFLTEETADNEARGLTPDEARRQARLKFGNPQKVRESLWMQNTPQRLAGIARDVKYAFRTLSRTPGFTIIAVAVMALCIGAATSLFTVMRSVLLRPLPFRDPARLVMVYEHFRGGELSYHPVAPADFYDWRSKTHGFEDMAIMRYCRVQPHRCAQRIAGVGRAQRQVPRTCFHCWECSRHWAGTLRRRTISAAAPL